jgi:hypothetical protein
MVKSNTSLGRNSFSVVSFTDCLFSVDFVKVVTLYFTDVKLTIFVSVLNFNGRLKSMVVGIM